MKVYQYEEFPQMLIKVSSKREYLEDLSQGKVFMNESGYFRKLDDTFRGDKFDGKYVVAMNSPEWCIKIGPTESNPEVITIPGTDIKNFTRGFKGDDKIPIFCCTDVTEEILEEPINHSMAFKENFIKEMEQFGFYYMIFSKMELITKLYTYIQKNGFGGKWGPVSYKALDNPYDTSAMRNDLNGYDAFFIKDISYKWQNEWRIILEPSRTPIITENEHYHIASIPPLNWFHIGEINELKTYKITAVSKD